MKTMTLTQYAKRIGVSQQRVSQYKRDGLLDGCYVMQGRCCLIDVQAADERLRGCLDPGQPARKARPPKPNPDLAEWCDRMNAALYEIYALAEALRQPKRRDVRSHVEAIGGLFRAE